MEEVKEGEEEGGEDEVKSKVYSMSL